MFRKRLSAYREMNYEIVIPESEKLARFVKKIASTGQIVILTYLFPKWEFILDDNRLLDYIAL